MKTKIAALAFMAAAFGTTTPTIAHEDTLDGSSHWIEHAQTMREPTANERARLGYAADRKADRALRVDARTRHLNVTQGEAVEIEIGGKRVTWAFDTLGTPTFPLAAIVPDAGNATVYVAPNPLYLGD